MRGDGIYTPARVQKKKHIYLVEHRRLKMVRSFSRVDPFPHGLRRDNETYVFLKWIATLAPLLVTDTFTEDTSKNPAFPHIYIT